MTIPEMIVAVQQATGQTTDGEAGIKTWTAIYSALVKPSDIVAQPSQVDSRSETNIKTLHEKVQPLARELIQRALAHGIIAVVTSGTRTYAEQDALYEQGRTKPGSIVTNARAGYSNHNFGLAFDLTIFSNGKPVWESPEYKTLGSIGKSLGLIWGGDWSTIEDDPHFELHPAWASGESESSMLAELRRRHENGQDAFA